MRIQLDKWQEEIMAEEGNILFCKGRRIGATHIFAMKAVEYLMNHVNHHPASMMVCVSLTEEQSKLIIAFATNYASFKYKRYLGKGKNKSTLNSLTLVVNGNVRTLLARPVGSTGDGVRGFEGQILMVDEGSRMPPLMWLAVKPILLTTGGKMWIWSTPFGKKTRDGKETYFYKSFLNKNKRFKVFFKDSEDVIYNRPISEVWTEEVREEAIKYLKEEKEDMTELEYGQEYLGLFLEELRQFYSEELLAETLVLKRRPVIISNRTYTIGCDVARMDRDEFTYEILDFIDNNTIEHVENIVTKNVPIPESTRRIIALNNQYKFRREYIDSGGMGITVCDLLREDSANRRKVVEINNVSRVYDKEDRTKKIIGEEGHNNLKKLMETGKLKLLDDENVWLSFRSIQAEHHPNTGVMKIWGSYSHIVEGVWRAAWYAKAKTLNLWAR